MPAFQADRKLVEVFNLTGGLNTAGDPSSMQPNEWRDCQNMMVAKPYKGPNSVGNSNYDFSAMSHPPVKNIIPSGSITMVGTNWTAPFKTLTLATGQNGNWPSETWTAGGAGTQSYQTTFLNYMDQCVQQFNTASQTTTSTITLTLKSSLANMQNMTQLLMDINVNAHSFFSSGYIRVGNNSSNYYQWNITSPTEGNQTLNFTWASPSSTTGTPNITTTVYIQVSSTATAGGTMVFQFNNIRLASLTAANGNIRDLFAYDRYADGSEPHMICIMGDTMWMSINGSGSGPALPTINSTATIYWSPISSQFTNWDTLNANADIHGTRFNFSVMADYKNGNPKNNVLYFVNGADGFFSFNFNSIGVGTSFSRISSTDYKYLINHKNYMFLTGRSDKPNEIDWSDLNDPSNLTTNASGNATIIQFEAGQYITGFLSFDNYLMVFRSSDVWQLTGNTNNDFALQRTKSKVGAIDQKYICRVGMQIFFASYAGLFSLNWWDESSDMWSRKVSNLFQNSSIKNYLSGFLAYNPLREILIFSMPNDASNDPATSLNTSYRLTFSIPSASYGGNIQGGAWGLLGKNSTNDSIAFCGYFYGGVSSNFMLSGYSSMFFEGGLGIYQWDAFAPDSISMNCMIRTAWHPAGHPKLFKNFDNAGFWVRTQSSLAAPTTPTVKDYYGFSDTATNTYTMPTPASGYTETLLQPNRAQAISLLIQSTQADQVANALQVSGYTFTWTQDGVI